MVMMGRNVAVTVMIGRNVTVIAVPWTHSKHVQLSNFLCFFTYFMCIIFSPSRVSAISTKCRPWTIDSRI